MNEIIGGFIFTSDHVDCFLIAYISNFNFYCWIEHAIVKSYIENANALWITYHIDANLNSKGALPKGPHIRYLFNYQVSWYTIAWVFTSFPFLGFLVFYRARKTTFTVLLFTTVSNNKLYQYLLPNFFY